MPDQRCSSFAGLANGEKLFVSRLWFGITLTRSNNGAESLGVLDALKVEKRSGHLGATKRLF